MTRVLTVALTLMGLLSSHSAEAQTATVVMGGKMIESVRLVKGGDLTVRLQTTPGTGFGWKLVKTDTNFLEHLGDTILPGVVKERQVGRPQDHEFHFRALKSGVSRLEFLYARPWEKNVPPLKIYRLKVKIR